MRLAICFLGALVIWSYGTRPQPSTKAQRPLLAGAQIDHRTWDLIERSCRDCHSEATRYPWYSYIAPLSVLINKDVREGREHLNFSRWAEYPFVRRQRALSEIANQVKDGEMPPAPYTFVHKDAKLSDTDADAIFQWTQLERQRLILEAK